jgi:hypothetical protein
MIHLVLNQELKDLIPRFIWFEDPNISIQNATRLLAYAMTYATHEDMRILRKYISDKDFLEALDKIPPGIVDPRSWSYWNLMLGRYPAPPMPTRNL